MSRRMPVPVSPIETSFLRRLWTSNAEGLLLKTQTSVHTRKYQPAHLLSIPPPPPPPPPQPTIQVACHLEQRSRRDRPVRHVGEGRGGGGQPRRMPMCPPALAIACRILVWYPQTKSNVFEHRILWKGLTSPITAVAFDPIQVRSHRKTFGFEPGSPSASEAAAAQGRRRVGTGAGSRLSGEA